MSGISKVPQNDGHEVKYWTHEGNTFVNVVNKSGKPESMMDQEGNFFPAEAVYNQDGTMISMRNKIEGVSQDLENPADGSTLASSHIIQNGKEQIIHRDQEGNPRGVDITGDTSLRQVSNYWRNSATGQVSDAKEPSVSIHGAKVEEPVGELVEGMLNEQIKDDMSLFKKTFDSHMPTAKSPVPMNRQEPQAFKTAAKNKPAA